LNKHLTELEDSQTFYNGVDITVDPHKVSLVIDESWFYRDENLMSAVFDWVNKGGQLVYLLSSSRHDEDTNLLLDEITSEIKVSSNDDSPYHDITRDGPSSNAYVYIPESSDGIDDNQLALNNTRQYSMITEFVNDSGVLYFAYQYVFDECYGYQWEVLNDDSETLACRVPVGSGAITALSSFYFPNSYALKLYDNAAFSLALFEPVNEILFLKGNYSIDWFTLLIGDHWELTVVLSIIALLLFWNLYSRFGPALSPYSDSSANYLDHIEMLGQFYRDNDYSGVMNQALKAEVELNNTTLSSSKPSLDNETLARLDAETFPDDPKVWIEHVRKIQKLRNKT